MKEILARLGLDEVNAGTWSGADSSASDDAALIASVNPASGQVIASVRSTTAEEYDNLVNNARAAFDDWRKVPAPVRGEAICSVMDLVMSNPSHYSGFIAQEEFGLSDILENRFGEYYAHGGTNLASAEAVARGETGHQR